MKHDGSPRFRYFRRNTSAGPGIPNLWVKVDVDADWRADLRLAVQGDRFVVAEVRLFPRPKEDSEAGEAWPLGETLGVHAKVPGTGITARLLHRVKLHVHEQMPYPLAAQDLFLDGNGMPLSRQPKLESSPPRGRPPIPDEELLKVAKVYDKAHLAKQNPTQAVVARLGMSAARARDLVYRARQRGFLTKAAWGRPSGRLTPEAQRLLESKRGVSRRKK